MFKIYVDNYIADGGELTVLASIGVLLLLMGVSAFVIGLIRRFFPSTEQFVPEDLKKFLSIQAGVYVFLAGLLLVRFF